MIELSKEYITGLIGKRGITKSEFAKAMGFQRQNLDAMLDAKKKDISMVVKMSEVLGLPLTELIGLSDEPTGPAVFGCLYINGKPRLINNRGDIEQVLKEIH